MANAHLSLNDPIHCPIVALSYNYDIKIVSFILLQNQKHVLYSNKKETSDFHGTVSFDPVKMSQQKLNQNVYQTSDTQKLVIILFSSSYLEELLNLMCTQLFPLSSGN